MLFQRLVPLCGLMAVAATTDSHRSYGFQQFPNGPNVIRNASFHRWSDAQRFVNAPKVIPRVPEDYGGPVVDKALAERIGEAREAS